ncbi:hypothetical protein BKA83DRAFT_1958788 [Pisolithus microcarpus]|nr:hypothetical protein BKA83DRAFT_1958788 [Pisolithus microcarpus]
MDGVGSFIIACFFFLSGFSGIARHVGSLHSSQVTPPFRRGFMWKGCEPIIFHTTGTKSTVEKRFLELKDDT